MYSFNNVNYIEFKSCFRLQHSDLDGNDVRTLQDLKMVHPFGVAVFNGKNVRNFVLGC